MRAERQYVTESTVKADWGWDGAEASPPTRVVRITGSVSSFPRVYFSRKLDSGLEVGTECRLDHGMGVSPPLGERPTTQTAR